MSKGKRVKSGSAHDINKWENGLNQAVLNEDAWKTCVFFLASNKPEDNVLISLCSAVISTGLRKLFSVISKEELYREVKDFAKAMTSGGGKGKTAPKLPDYVEICEHVKPFIDQGDDVPPKLLAKLLKFKLLLLKTRDIEKREDARKEQARLEIIKKGEKRSASPGKRSKSPKKKGKKNEAEKPSSPKKDTKLRKRGEADENFKTIDDEPDEEGSPQHYVIIHGFHSASTLQHLANIGVHVNALIKLRQNEYTSKSPLQQQEETHTNADDNDLQNLENMVKKDDVTDQSRDEEDLEAFWKESDELVLGAPTGHKLKDIAKYEVTISNPLPHDQTAAEIAPEKKIEIGTMIFTKIANVCYDMLDHHKNYQRYLSAMKLLHIPVHTPSSAALLDTHPAIQSAADTPQQVEIDKRYYNHLVNSIPDESISVPLILHCLLEQVVATVDDTNPLEKLEEVRKDGLDNDLADHINSKIAALALSTEEKQEILDADRVKKRENVNVPEILQYNDKLSQRLHYLEDISILDSLATERTMLDMMAPLAFDSFPYCTAMELMERSARFHQFVQHCSFPSAENVSYLLKKYTFEGMLLRTVDADSNVAEVGPESNKNSWDDPYSDFSIYGNAGTRGEGVVSGDAARVSAAVNLVSFRNLDDWCYVEEFDKTTFIQVLEAARHSHPYMDSYYHQHDDTLLLVYHNPVGKQLHNTCPWNVRLLSDVGFRNYLEHIDSMIREWNMEQQRIEEENNRTPTPVPVTPEPPVVEVKSGSRYGLKTRAEVAALKAEEEDKGKKKGKRSGRSATPRSAKKGSAAVEKKGSAAKSRATSGKGSKGKLAQEVEVQLQVDDVDANDAEKQYNFLGYDVGDDLLHVTGVQSSMFPSDGGEIRVEKTEYVRGACSVSTSVHKNGDILKLHFLEPLKEVLSKQVSCSGTTLVSNVKSLGSHDACPGKTEDDGTLDEPSDEGIEKSEFEANEKSASFNLDVDGVDIDVTSQLAVASPPAFCAHASFVAQLNDGMVITSSGFGAHGKPIKNEARLNKETATAGVPLDASPQPKALSPKARKKNDDEAKRLEEQRLAEERLRLEEEARRLKEQRESLKKPFHEIFVSCPDGLHVSFRNDENYASFQDSGGVIVRQRYPFKSRGMHECEATRGKVAMRELSRSVKTDGTVIKLMLDNSVEILYPDGSTSTCPEFPEKSATPTEQLNTQPANRKAHNAVPLASATRDEADDQWDASSGLSAQWRTVTADGERLVQSLDGGEHFLEALKLSIATCPVSNEIYKTREDNVITVVRPDGTQIVEHSDGTRITTYHDLVRTEVAPPDQETGEKAEYESHVCKHVKVECESFATVVMDTEHGSAVTLFGNGHSIRTKANGECVVEKSDASRLCFDIKGNVAYVPREVFDQSCPSCLEETRPGVYLLRTTSQHCCEHLDERGNVFSAYTNGEIRVVKPDDHDNVQLSNDDDDAEASLSDHITPSGTPHVPRFFVMRRDGTGYELLRQDDLDKYLQAAEDDVSTAVLRTPVEGLPGVTGITVLKPFPGGVGKTWLKEKDEKVLIPIGLRERDFKMFPAKEFKKVGPKFGCNAGVALNVGNMKKSPSVKPQITCPRVLVLRHVTQYEPSDTTHRQTISAAFQQYGDYVTKLQLEADGCLPHESRGKEEVERANQLASKYEPAVKSNKIETAISVTNDLSKDYVKSVTPAECPPPPAPVWKRSQAEWERDRIELAKLDYGKHALRYQEVPPYFETAQGQAFLSGIKMMPDMAKLTADLDKQACPARAITGLRSSSSSTPAESADQSNTTQEASPRGEHNDLKSGLDRFSSAVLENLDGHHSPGDPPLQSSTPFASRPVNPTPAQAAGIPTPTATRPTNPTPRQNVIGSEGPSDSPRTLIPEYIPLQALVEAQHEVSCMDDNDTALDLMSSTNSHYNDSSRPKSLYADVTGSPRKDTVRLPNVLLGAKPGALPNTQFSLIEDPVRRKVQTVSVAGKTASLPRGFELFPPEIDFGVLKEGCTYTHSVLLKNIGIDSCRFRISQPPPSTGIKILFTPGPVAAGMNKKLEIEIFAVAVGVSGESGIGSIGHHIEIIGETDIIYLPVMATILTAYEYDNRSPSLPQGFHSVGTQVVSNRSASRETIRPQRDHVYSTRHF